MPGRVILLCGLAGAGKTTVAKTIDGVRMSPDEWMRALDIDLWEPAPRQRIEALQWTLTQELALRGETVVIEWGVWSRAERDRVRGWCRENDVAVELRYLDVPIEELVGRLEIRNAQPGEVMITADVLRYWSTIFEAPTAEELALFDRGVSGVS